MTDRFVLDSPVDMHAHLRQDDLLWSLVPLTSAVWAAVLAMPNTDPIIDSPQKAVEYKRAILYTTSPRPFEVYTTLYFQTHYTRAFLEDSKPHILSIKFYPKNLTTNSQHGCDPDDPAVLDVLGSMEELDIPLNIHPEAEGYYHDREQLFGRYIERWATSFPRLKIVMEHLSDRHSLKLLDLPNVYATVTPQHLLTTGNDWFGPPFDPYLYCMPCVKRPEDRDALLEALASPRWSHKIMAGTDSAPHTKDRKVHCGCAGVFTAPIALQLYTQAYDRLGGDVEGFQNFVSGNARRIYGIEPPKTRVVLVREPFVVPARYDTVVPMWAGKIIGWSIVNG